MPDYLPITRNIIECSEEVLSKLRRQLGVAGISYTYGVRILTEQGKIFEVKIDPNADMIIVQSIVDSFNDLPGWYRDT